MFFKVDNNFIYDKDWAYGKALSSIEKCVNKDELTYVFATDCFVHNDSHGYSEILQDVDGDLVLVYVVACSDDFDVAEVTREQLDKDVVALLRNNPKEEGECQVSNLVVGFNVIDENHAALRLAWNMVR